MGTEGFRTTTGDCFAHAGVRLVTFLNFCCGVCWQILCTVYFSLQAICTLCGNKPTHQRHDIWCFLLGIHYTRYHIITMGYNCEQQKAIATAKLAPKDLFV